jgi:fucose 4-O-acetylase-like acetyltransferase
MIRYDLTFGKEELDTMCRLSLSEDSIRRKQRPTKVLCLVFAAVALFLGVVYLTHQVIGIGIFMVAAAVFFAFMALWGMMLIQLSGVKKQLRKENPALFHTVRHYTFDESGVSLSSKYGSGRTPWSDFRQWGTVKHYIYLQRQDHGIILVDRKKLSQEEADALYGILSPLPRKDR